MLLDRTNRRDTSFTSLHSYIMCVYTCVAVRDLPLGAECDEINERRYCAQGLVCQRCSSKDPAFRCLRCE